MAPAVMADERGESLEDLERKCDHAQAEAQRSMGSMRGLSLSLVDRLRDVEARASSAESEKQALKSAVRELRDAVNKAATLAHPVNAEDGPVLSAVTLTDVRTALLDIVKIADKLVENHGV